MAKDTPVERSYDRSWGEIEAMLDNAIVRLADWKSWFSQCQKDSLLRILSIRPPRLYSN